VAAPATSGARVVFVNARKRRSKSWRPTLELPSMVFTANLTIFDPVGRREPLGSTVFEDLSDQIASSCLTATIDADLPTTDRAISIPFRFDHFLAIVIHKPDKIFTFKPDCTVLRREVVSVVIVLIAEMKRPNND
jgi:hypothetical protein